MRKQYHFWPAASGSGLFDAWDVDRLIVLSAELPVEQVALDSIAEVDSRYWSDGTPASQTVRRVVEHVRYIVDADLSYPIILGVDGRVMDGMHRIARALLDGQQYVAARRFPVAPAPDYVDVRADELPYTR